MYNKLCIGIRWTHGRFYSKRHWFSLSTATEVSGHIGVRAGLGKMQRHLLYTESHLYIFGDWALLPVCSTQSLSAPDRGQEMQRTFTDYYYKWANPAIWRKYALGVDETPKIVRHIKTFARPFVQFFKFAHLEAVFTENFHFGRLVPAKVAQSAISEENRGLRVGWENALSLIFAKLLKIATFHG